MKISDFTTAKKLITHEYICNDDIGTPHFKAPEITNHGGEGYLGPPCDIWGLGATLYTFLAEGKPPTLNPEITPENKLVF